MEQHDRGPEHGDLLAHVGPTLTRGRATAGFAPDDAPTADGLDPGLSLAEKARSERELMNYYRARDLRYAQAMAPAPLPRRPRVRPPARPRTRGRARQRRSPSRSASADRAESSLPPRVRQILRDVRDPGMLTPGLEMLCVLRTSFLMGRGWTENAFADAIVRGQAAGVLSIIFECGEAFVVVVSV